MIEVQFRFVKLFGAVSLLFGGAGLLYLVWIYVIWSNILPAFPTNTTIITRAASGVVAEPLGFGNLLIDPAPSRFNDLLAQNQVNAPTEIPAVLGETVPTSTEVSLTVPTLGLNDIKVQLGVDGNDEEIYDTVLTHSVAHLQNSALPGELGNTFLFGHSKLPIFAGSDYESIFTNLPKVKEGDIVKVSFLGKSYVYLIKQTGVVDPQDVYVMHQPSDRRMITLMTCIPPGFDNKRYITVGELVSVHAD